MIERPAFVSKLAQRAIAERKLLEAVQEGELGQRRGLESKVWDRLAGEQPAARLVVVAPAEMEQVLFVGGPWHGRRELVTQGHGDWSVIVPQPLKLCWDVNPDLASPIIEVVTYFRRRYWTGSGVEQATAFVLAGLDEAEATRLLCTVT